MITAIVKAAKNEQGLFVSNTNQDRSTIKKWAKDNKYTHKEKVSGGIKFTKQEVNLFIYKKKYKGRDTWIALLPEDQDKKDDQKRWLYVAAFKEMGKEVRLLYFEKKQKANSYSKKKNIFEALYKTIRKQHKVTSVFIPKSNKTVFEAVKKGDRITDLRKKDQQKVLKGEVISWALHKKEKSKFIFNYAFLTYGKKGQVDGVKITRTACFVAGTPVFIGLNESTGKPHYKNIEQVHSGDVLPSFAPQTGKIAYKTVKGTSQSMAEAVVKIYAQGKLALMPTPEHPFWIKGQWKSAGELTKGDHLWRYNGQQIAIDSVVYVDTLVKVYNFEVTDYHTYFVGELGVGVHNSCAVVEYIKENMLNTKAVWLSSGNIKHPAIFKNKWGYEDLKSMVEKLVQADPTLSGKTLEYLLGKVPIGKESGNFKSNQIFKKYPKLTFGEVTQLQELYLKLPPNVANKQKDDLLYQIHNINYLVSSFAIWASLSDEKKDFRYDKKFNCWEMILIAAYKSGEVSWNKIHNIYQGTVIFSLLEELCPMSSLKKYQKNKVIPDCGDLVFFKAPAYTSHVAIATGVISKDGSPELYTFWPSLPGTPPLKEGDNATIRKSSINEISDKFQKNSFFSGVYFSSPRWKINE